MNIIIYNKSLITAWQLEIKGLEGQIANLDHLSLNASEREQKKDSLLKEITSLEKNIAEGMQFLTDLEKNPNKLVTELSNNILTSLTDYKNKHPKDLPIEIIGCLHELGGKLSFIQQSIEQQKLVRSHQIHYWKLCAFIQDMHEEVKNKNIDPIFIKLLEDLLESTHIDLEGDLPDEMRTSQTMTSYRRELKRNSHLFPDPRQLLEYEKKRSKEANKKEADQTTAGDAVEPTPTPESIPEPIVEELATNQTITAASEEPLPVPESIEEQYAKLLKNLQTRPVVKNTLQTKIDHAVHAVDEEVRIKKQRKEVIDYHFYNQLLTHLWDLSNPSTDPATFIPVFTKLTEDVIDTSSFSKKVAGAILAIVGVLLIAASIATLVATFSSSSLVSSVGIAFGISLLSSQTVLASTACVTAGIGAGLTFWGVNTFKEGQGRELPKAIHEVKEELTVSYAPK